MKKTHLLTFAGLVIIPLAGCGMFSGTTANAPLAPASSTAVNQSPPDSTSGSPSNVSTENHAVSNVTNTTSSRTVGAHTLAPANPPDEKNFTFETEGMTETVKGTYHTSRHQPLGMYVLKGYTVNDTNAHKFVITSNNVPNASMQITVLSKSASMDELKQNIQAELKSVSSQVVAVQDDQLRNDKFFQNAIIYSASNRKTVQTIYLVALNGIPVEISVQGPKEMEDTVPFQVMMKTISILPS